MKNNNLYNVLGHVNQFGYCDNDKAIFQSYNSTCVIIDKKNNVITFGIDRNYSKTTSKHVYAFLYDNYINLNNKKEVQNAIDNGSYNGYKVQLDVNLR